MQFIGIEAANSSTKVVSGDVVKNYDNRLKQLYRQELSIMGGKSDTVYTYDGQRYILSDHHSQDTKQRPSPPEMPLCSLICFMVREFNVKTILLKDLKMHSTT